ncbi:MAG: S8 family serine peptidase [Promethearchaeota archaeon]
MTSLKNKTKIIIIIIIIINYFIVPFIGIQLANSIPNNQNKNTAIDINSLKSSIKTISNSKNVNQESFSSHQNPKFDSELNKLLTNLIKRPQSIHKDIDVIISFDESLSKEERITILDSVFDNYELKNNYDLISAVHVKINPDQLIIKKNEIEGIYSIKEIHESKFYQLPYVKDDTIQLSALNSEDYSNWWLPAIGAENLPYNGTGVKVAVIDTGIYHHPDLNIINERNFISEEGKDDYNDLTGHGTHAAGIIAGDGGGSSGEYRGVAPGALLINARAGNESGLAESDIIAAIEWSSKPTSVGGAGADIISMSFGGGYPYISDNITDTISKAKNDYGVIFVASAGNSGPQYFSGSTPAAGIDVISVGATNRSNGLASFSSWGPTFSYIGYPDVVAPGVNIISTEAKGSTFSREERYKGDYFDFSGDADYIPLSGTSFSCPMVAGALAILLDAYPYITPETARIALLEGASPLSDDSDNDILKSGTGIINVTASLSYLESLSTNYNNTAKIYPDNLPIKPFDLLHFPGDHQKFNLTVISGESKTFNIEVPSNIQGISLSIDKSPLIFSKAGVGFIELDIEIEQNAIPEIKMFQINLTSGIKIYDIINITLDIRLPEYRVLMESYHGLNDWFADEDIGYTFYQMGFYEAMNDLTELNISIDYSMEYWTPDYDKNINNSLLTEERLAQYDIVILQNPILPYSPSEIRNLETYFNNGGNLLFLGTRYQDMIVENINYLFSRLGVDIQVNEENILDDEWLGIGASVNSQTVHNFNDSKIFNNVSQFYWFYGNTFTISDNANSIATIDNKTVVALYDGTEYAKGKFLAFGDLYWLYDQYDASSFAQDHHNLLTNIIDFLLPPDEISINIDLGKESSSNSENKISICIKNQTSETPITNSDYSSLSVMFKNGIFQGTISLNISKASEGIYFNNSFNLPDTSSTPYTIIVNLTFDSIEFNKTTKILYYNNNEMPKISEISLDKSSITRANNQQNLIIAELDDNSYDPFEGYLSIYSYSFYNTKQSINKTLTFSFSPGPGNNYSEIFYPEETDPSGYAIFYLEPSNSNYSTSNSPRISFRIKNNPPEILNESSSFDYDSFANTASEGASYVYRVKQDETLNFVVDVADTVNYEDSRSNMRVFINLFITVAKEDGHIMVIFPDVFEVAELTYQTGSNKYQGTFTIPKTMRYNTISGTRSVSTITNYNSASNSGYLGILIITVYDSEGGYDDFIIVLLISGPLFDFSSLIYIIPVVIGVVVVIGFLIYLVKRQKRVKVSEYQPRYQDYYYEPSYEPSETTYITPEPLSNLEQFYCPFCGHLIRQPKKFCPSCGESLSFTEKND